MPGTSLHPATAENRNDIGGESRSGNDAELERARLRLDRAFERLDHVLEGRVDGLRKGAEAEGQLRAENARLLAENTRLRKNHGTVETRLDAAIGRLQGVLGEG